MPKKILSVLSFILIHTASFSQIGFENEKLLIDNHQMAATNSEILLSDLNNDGAKDFIAVVTSSPGRISIYPNVQGDFTTTPMKLVFHDYNAIAEYPSGVSTIDIDNDGLLDIVACNRFSNKINWFKNLGNFNFSPITTLMEISTPNLMVAADVDNDGFMDLVVNQALSSQTVIWLKNNGNGTFTNQQSIYGSNSNAVRIVCKDLNNDGLPELIVSHTGGNVYWKKNSGNGTFEASLQLANANSGKAFDFEDINGDNYPDYISNISGAQTIKQLSQSGNSFAASQTISTVSSFMQIAFRDVDEDGITDLVGATGTGIVYMKRLSNGTFQSSAQLISITPVTYFIAEDLNSDNRTDFIIPCYNSQGNSGLRTVAYLKAPTSGSYVENLISYYNSFPRNVKVADLDNDGNNDIISSFRSLVWNKNKGGGDFTSYRKISNGYPNSGNYNFDIEAVDIDNDNDKDIVTSINGGIEIFFNDGLGNFSLGYSTTLPYSAINIEVADLNGDLFKDIIMTFNINGSSGELKLAWIPNLSGTTFGSLTTIGLSQNSYMPYLLECADMDNDGDIDIVTYSNEYSRLHLHTNNGSGVFTYSPISDVVSAVTMAVEDFDNDGDKDIFVAGVYYPGIYLIKNNNGVFANKVLLALKKADDIDFTDLNGDGLKDLVGTLAIPDSDNPASLFYFLNDGNGFGSQVLLDTETGEMGGARMTIGDLNNDAKPDIVNCFFLSGKVCYFLNSSTLSVENPEAPDDTIVVFPNPFSDILNWQIPNGDSGSYDVKIFNVEGKLVYSKNGLSSPYLDLRFLEKGFYIFNLKTDNKSFSRNIIKN